MSVTVVDHPLVQHKLTIMRNKETSTASFRRLLREISLLLGYEVTRDLELTTTTIETPMETMEAPILEGKKLVFASVLRAGNGLLEGLLDLVPAARVAHIGLYRDHETLEAVEYFFKAPSDLADRLIIVVDPMLATANSAICRHRHAEEAAAPRNLRYLCLLAAPEGVKRFTKAHPDVPGLHRVHRPAVEREGLYPAGPGRRRRPHLRDEVGGPTSSRSCSIRAEQHPAQNHLRRCRALLADHVGSLHSCTAAFASSLAIGPARSASGSPRLDFCANWASSVRPTA